LLFTLWSFLKILEKAHFLQCTFFYGMNYVFVLGHFSQNQLVVTLPIIICPKQI
jgi:hypothetical protein